MSRLLYYARVLNLSRLLYSNFSEEIRDFSGKIRDFSGEIRDFWVQSTIFPMKIRNVQ